jgi:hypothetical protein
VSSPDPLVYFAVLKTKDARVLEALMHEEFAEYRVHGEWFSINPAVVLDCIESASWPDLVRIYPPANDNNIQD